MRLNGKQPCCMCCGQARLALSNQRPIRFIRFLSTSLCPLSAHLTNVPNINFKTDYFYGRYSIKCPMKRGQLYQLVLYMLKRSIFNLIILIMFSLNKRLYKCKQYSVIRQTVFFYFCLIRLCAGDVNWRNIVVCVLWQWLSVVTGIWVVELRGWTPIECIQLIPLYVLHTCYIIWLAHPT